MKYLLFYKIPPKEIAPPPHQPKGKAFRTHPPPPLKKESLKTKQNNRQQKLVQSISQKGGIQ